MSPRPSAPVPLNAVSFPFYSSPCTQTPAPPVISLPENTTLIGLIDHLVIWCGHNNLELNALKTVKMVVDFRKNPALPAPSPCVTPQLTLWLPFISWAPPAPRTSVGAEHQLHHPKGPAEDVFPAAAKGVQPAKDNDGALLHHHH